MCNRHIMYNVQSAGYDLKINSYDPVFYDNDLLIVHYLYSCLCYAKSE